MREFIAGNLKIVAKPHNLSLFSAETKMSITSELIQALTEAGEFAWKNLKYHEANSFGNDYYEYYDRELDSEGYLRIIKGFLVFDRPADSYKLYQFNKAKFQTFMYDLLRIKEAAE